MKVSHFLCRPRCLRNCPFLPFFSDGLKDYAFETDVSVSVRHPRGISIDLRDQSELFEGPLC